MKKISLILMLIAFNANADDGSHHEETPNPVSTAGAGLIGSNNNTIRNVPTAIAPSVNTSIVCPMVLQGSKAGSVFFISLSGTHQADLVPICVAWHLGQKDVVERIACNASPDYAKANPGCAK